MKKYPFCGFALALAAFLGACGSDPANAPSSPDASTPEPDAGSASLDGASGNDGNGDDARNDGAVGDDGSGGSDGALGDDGSIPPGSAIQFEVGRPFPAMFSSNLTLADITGDGLPDVLGLNHWDDNIEVKPGDGKGAFGAAIASAHHHTQQESYATGDYDADGDLDVALPTGKQLDWFLNDGAGHFAQGPSTPLADSVDAVFIVDVTGDKRPDVIASSFGTVRVYAGLAGGGFATSGKSSSCLDGGLGPVVGDFDGNGRLDVAMGGSGGIAICRGDGAGGFAAGPGDKYTIAGSTTIYGSAPGTSGHPTLYAVTNQSITSFDDIQGGALVNVASITRPAPYLIFVAAGDFDGDGTSDVLAETWDGGSDYDLDVYVRKGPDLKLLAAYDWTSGGAVVGDVNKDGALDVVHDAGFEVVVVRGRGDGTLRAAPTWPLAANGTFTRLAEVTGDGRPDIVATGGALLGVVVAQAAGAPVALAPKTISGEVRGLEVADVDGNGHADVLLLRSAPDELDLLPGDGTGAFGAPQALRGAGGAFGVGNLDGDAKADVVQAASPGLDVRLGKTGQWSPIAGITDWIGWILLRDFDGDTRVDVLFLSDDGTTQALKFLKGRGDGTFDAAVVTQEAIGYGVDAADIDGDGDLDLVSPAGGASAYLFDSGHFGAPIVTTGNKLQNLRQLALADFDKDGHPDLVFSGGYGMVVLKGDGTGHFASAFEFATEYVDALAVGDFDRDGRVDIVGNGEGLWFGRNVTGLP